MKTIFKSLAAKVFASFVCSRLYRWQRHPEKTQQRVLSSLISSARHTAFGRDHDFKNIYTPKDFANRVPIRDYEKLAPYIERIKNGESDILWREKPLYFAKTSGTTSGIKYIPLTKESMPYQIQAARDAILHYIQQTGQADIIKGKMIFLQGSPEINQLNGIGIGRLSGIVAHHVPAYLQTNRMPTWETNCMTDWETKIDAIVEETKDLDMRIISGIPSWVQMYFEKLLQSSKKKTIKEIFPNFNLFIYGGVNFGPYKSKFETLIGGSIDNIELYPASEGFFAFQDSRTEEGMLLLLNSGIYYEFVKLSDWDTDNPRRLTIREVVLKEYYVMLISTNAGLWAYYLGDIISFVSLSPHRIIITGRVAHYISAFGEHVISKEVETAMEKACKQTSASVNEFTVAPMVVPPKGGLPYHQWCIAFAKEPSNMNVFSETLDQLMQQQNIYYRDLIEGQILQPLKISKVHPNGFTNYMKSINKLGGQNKVRRLSNDRSLVDHLDFKIYIQS